MTLSIITPCKNAAPWIEACLQSVLNQGFTDWEWIWVNDHSTDNSFDLVSAFADLDACIQIHKNPGNDITPALEEGLRQSQGRYVTRMDADDLMPEGRLEKMVKALEETSPKTIVTGKVEYFSETEVSEGYRKYEKWINNLQTTNKLYANIYRECVIASPNWMMRTDELRATGGFSDLAYPEDYDLVFRWYENQFRFKVLPEVTLLWREHPLRTSRNSINYSQQKFFELKLKRFMELNLNTKNLVLWGTGVKGRLSAEILDKLKVPFHWMDLQPGKFEHGINSHPILPFNAIETLEQPQLLIAVYPPQKEMQKLLTYLQRLSLQIAVDYWFL